MSQLTLSIENLKRFHRKISWCPSGRSWRLLFSRMLDLFLYSHCYSDQDQAQLSLRSWISVVTGKMKAIDREDKHVKLMANGRVNYDYLILCTGLQYQVRDARHNINNSNEPRCCYELWNVYYVPASLSVCKLMQC